MNTVAERDAASRPECDRHVRLPTLNRIDATFARLRAAGRTALIPYVTAGDPSLAATLPIMRRAGRARAPT